MEGIRSALKQATKQMRKPTAMPDLMMTTKAQLRRYVNQIAEKQGEFVREDIMAILEDDSIQEGEVVGITPGSAGFVSP